MSSSKTVAVVGASADRRKFGNKAVRAYVRQGFSVIPVNPRELTIEGLTCYPSVLAVPGPINMATLYVRAEAGLEVLPELARKGIREVWLNPGADAPAVVERARHLGLEPIVACSIMGIGENPTAP